MPHYKGLRNKEVTTGSGKDVKDTSMLSGQARRTKAEMAKNETKEYTTGKPKHGNIGGMNRGS